MKRFVRVVLATAIAVVLASILIKAVVGICSASNPLNVFEWFFLVFVAGVPFGILLAFVVHAFPEEK